MSNIIYADQSMIPDMKALKSAELVFSGQPIGICRETRSGSSVRGAMETLKRWISSSAFSVIVLSGFTAVLPEIKESFVFWVSDHLAEPGSPLLIAISSGPWKEGVICSGTAEMENYLKNIK